MRCSQLLERFGRSAFSLNGYSGCWQSCRAYATQITELEASSSNADALIFAACVLQRLPILRPAVPPHHAQHLIWSRQRGLESGTLKDYPEAATKGRGDMGSKQEKQDLRTFSPVPSLTSADDSGDVRSMRRRLSEGLYLVVRNTNRGDHQQHPQQLGQRQAGEGSSPPGPGSSGGALEDLRGGRGGSGSSSSSSSEGHGGGSWAFPLAANTGEESISETAHRALHAVIGRSHPVFFVGKAPMAHLVGPRRGIKTFFMLAQTVDDPWDIRLVEGGPAQEFAWVTKQELLETYLSDARLRELVSKMLSAKAASAAAPVNIGSDNPDKNSPQSAALAPSTTNRTRIPPSCSKSQKFCSKSGYCRRRRLGAKWLDAAAKAAVDATRGVGDA
ncbi:hypothetical protein VOLCADRAFT_121613, partial [Volvox carteri f. nagariensis]